MIKVKKNAKAKYVLNTWYQDFIGTSYEKTDGALFKRCSKAFGSNTGRLSKNDLLELANHSFRKSKQPILRSEAETVLSAILKIENVDYKIIKGSLVVKVSD